MRKIFDPDSLLKSSLIDDVSVSHDQNTKVSDEDLLQMEIDIDASDYHLRQQILFQMFTIDEHRLT